MTTLKQDWDAWRQRHEQKAHDETRRREQRIKATRRPVTDCEKEAIIALSGCSFLPGGWEKRFVSSLYTFNAYSPNRANSIIPVEQITERQGYWLARVVVRYRRQLKLTDVAASWWKNRAEEIMAATGKEGMDVSGLGAELADPEAR